MTIKTGTHTRWVEFEGELAEFDREELLVYCHPGHTVGEIDYLVEAVRADGAVVNLAEAYRRIDNAKFFLSYIGMSDEGQMVQCSKDGETSEGEFVEPSPCVFAVM